MISYLQGPWTIKFLNSPKVSTLTIKGTKLVLDGKPVTLSPSDNPNYPTAKGWLKGSLQDFYQFTPLGIDYVVVAGPRVFTTVVSKVIPAPSKCFICNVGVRGVN